MEQLSDNFIGFNHGRDKVIIDARGKPTFEYRPTEIHLKEAGAAGDTPSFTILMEGTFKKVYGQLSLKMLNEGLRDIGYEIRKI